MKKSENARRIWRGISASRSTNFQTFLSVQFFLIAIRLGICGGGSAPHFAANAVLNETVYPPLNAALRSITIYQRGLYIKTAVKTKLRTRCIRGKIILIFLMDQIRQKIGIKQE